MGAALFLFISGGLEGQTDWKKPALRYMQALADKNHTEVIAQSEPGLVEAVGREAMRAWLDLPYSDPETRVTLVDPRLISAKGPLVQGDRLYVQVAFKLRIQIELLPPEGHTQPLEETRAFYQQVLESSYGADRVRYSEKRHEFVAQTENTLWGFADSTGRWTFVENREETRDYMLKSLPAEVLKIFTQP